MKKLLFLVFVLSCSLSFANESTFDYIFLQSGASLQGQVIKIGKNRFKIRIDNKNHFVDNKDVLGVVFDQQLTDKEKQDLGYLDGKRFAKNQTGNFLFGTVSLITLGFPIAIIYVTSKQAPHSNGITEKNELIIDDEHYSIFKMTRKERREKLKLSIQSPEIDWSIYDVPTIERNYN